MNLDALTSAIYNNVVTGLKGTTQNFSFTLEQIADEIIEERLTLIKEYLLKNILPFNEVSRTIRCVPVDCKDLERCCALDSAENTKWKHFEIPALMSDFGQDVIQFIGPSDYSVNYKAYLNNYWRHHNKKMRKSNRPYVWIDTNPNANGKFDGFIFNQPPLMDQITITAIFKDPRQLQEYSCCESEDNSFSFLERDIKMRLTERYFRYFRQVPTPITPNDLTVKP